MATGLRVAFAGTPDLAATLLERLLDQRRHSVEHVFTQPDRPAGRGRKLAVSPVKSVAEKAGIPLSQPRDATELGNHQALTEADVLVVAAFGLILPETVLNLPRYGSVNVHFSLLPRWRGASPIQRAIEAGDTQTGITIMQMEAGLDTGPILLQRSCSINSDDTAGTLHERLTQIGGDCLLEALDGMAAGDLKPVPQDAGLATYARKISKAEAEIDWSARAVDIERRIRAYNPVPVAHTRLCDQPMRIRAATVLPDATRASPGTPIGYSAEGLDVATGEGVLRLLDLQLPGRKAVSIREFYHGHPEFLGGDNERK